MTVDGDWGERRRFSRSERAVLYLAANGRCARCGTELKQGWHADHMRPYSRNGATDVANGQALCPRCNLRKGNSVANLRKWQRAAIDQFYAHGERDFLACATPGAGKTTFGLELARQLLEGGTVRRVAVIVPTDSLRQQWADAAGRFGLALMPVNAPEDYEKAGYSGYVATYAQLGRGAGADLARRATRIPTMALLDEIHHAGDSRSWGDGLTHAFEGAVTRVALTGTPWRHDKSSPIPFVRYGSDGKVIVDAGYEYGQAVADGVCRPIEFHAYDGEARWRDCGEARSASLGADLPDDDVPAVLDAVLNPDHEWIPGLLAAAATALDEVRIEVPDAGGLVVANEMWQARKYADLLTRITGERATVALSDDPDAKGNIDSFRAGRSRWLVAVKMVSEGVDIPRLAVGVFASRTKTPLFFRQVVGRFVRVRPNEEFNARLFIPALPTLMEHARTIEDELRHQLEVEREREERDRKDRDGQQELSFRESIGATEATFAEAIYKGDGISPQELAQAQERCRQVGIPAMYASGVAQLMRGGLPSEPTVEASIDEEVPRHRLEKMLRGDLKKLTGKIAYRISGGSNLGMATKEVNAQLLREGFPVRAKASLEQLESMRDYLVQWLGTLS